MAAKKKGKKKAVKKAAGRKPVAQRAPRKKREPVPQHGLPSDPVGAQNPQADEPVGSSSGTTFGTAVVSQCDPIHDLPAELVKVAAAVGGTVGLGQGEGATKTLKIFKAEAEGDTIYVEAEDLDQAKNKFTAVMGEMPEGLVTWTEVDALPEGEEFMVEPAKLDLDSYIKEDEYPF